MPPTRWSQVRGLAGDDAARHAALSWLCEAYWEPLYRMALRRGRDHHAAQDLVQDFLVRVAEHGLGDPDPSAGRFRSWLLAAFWHHAADARDRERAAKRGGGVVHVAPPDDLPAVECIAFDRDFAQAVIARAFAALAAADAADDRARRWQERLRPFLAGDADGDDAAHAARDLESTPGAVRVAIHRLRVRLRSLIRAEVAETVADPAEVAVELRALGAAETR